MVPDLISAHSQKIPMEIPDYQYLNIMVNSIIGDETGESLEYRYLINVIIT